MPAARCTRVYINDTLFEEEALQPEDDEPAEELDLRLHDDDDDGEDQVQEGRGAEDWIPEMTGIAVLRAGCPRRSRRTLFVFSLRAPKRLPNVFTPMEKRMGVCILPLLRTCQVVPPTTTTLVVVPNGQMICGSRAHCRLEGSSASGQGFCDPRRHGVPHSCRLFDGSHVRHMYALNTIFCSFLSCGLPEVCLCDCQVYAICFGRSFFCSPFSLSLCLSRFFWWIFFHVRTLPWTKSLVNGTGDETPS